MVIVAHIPEGQTFSADLLQLATRKYSRDISIQHHRRRVGRRPLAGIGTLEITQVCALHQIYEAMDWLFARKEATERKLARHHLTEGSVVLCDVTSTYVEGYGADLAEFGYNRDGKKQINFGLLCDKEGRPVGVEVFSGSVADPCTLTRQLNKLRNSYGLS